MQVQFDRASRAQLPARDQQAISQTLGRLLRGFTERNADALTGVYSADADWVNAFGSRKRGGAEIVAYLRGLFHDANFNEGKLVADPEIVVRVLSEDIVTVSGHLRVQGQRLLDGNVIAERDNHSIRILQRQPGGAWPIVSEMYMDANQEQSYAGG